jgi:hypothetical protein
MYDSVSAEAKIRIEFLRGPIIAGWGEPPQISPAVDISDGWLRVP